MKILSLIPPLVQINTPYPATSFLTGFLRSRGYQADQRDLGLALVLDVFSRRGLQEILKSVKLAQKSEILNFFIEAYDDYEKTIEPTIRFLQGHDPALAHRIASRTLLPEGPRFQSLDVEDLNWAFGKMGVQDQAKHLASLYLDDLVDIIQIGVDPYFSLSRYAEKIAASQATMDPILDALAQKSNLVDLFLNTRVQQVMDEIKPEVVILTVPFPGCVLGALKIAKEIKRIDPATRVLMGGGYVNTELRSIKDARIFDFIDALTLDDGERPLECLLEYFQKKRDRSRLFRTFLRSDKMISAVEWCHDPSEHDVPQAQTGYPTIDGLLVRDYISMVEMLNPMHRFWSDLYWNKLMLAHGCYWHQCSFCDVHLDYIGRYEGSPVQLTVDRMKRLAKESGSSGFHFVDEAAPPAILKSLSSALIEQKQTFSWWGNIRFEKTFQSSLTDLMADAGCVAVSGGLEVASDRLLKMMKKGVTVEQVAKVTRNFRRSNVLVHAYLMYGFPTETLQETIDSLERVRQLFLHQCLTSAFWHRFSATAHSPVGHDPEAFGIIVNRDSKVRFGENDLPFVDPLIEKEKIPMEKLGFGLKKAVYNYMLGIGVDQPLDSWFDFKVPKTTVRKNLIRDYLA